jgi:hypothetical protein
MRITSLAKTCPFCVTDGGKRVYIRYRHGVLLVELDGNEIFSKVITQDDDGFMDYQRLVPYLSDIFDISLTDTNSVDLED